MNTIPQNIQKKYGSLSDELNQETRLLLQNSTIMIVDDEVLMLEIVQVLLEDAGYRYFVKIEHSLEAVNQLIETQPDIVLLDLDMPELHGFEVLKAIRAIDEFRFLPVIILTASEEADSKLKALEWGATDFLSKPVDPSELALRVRNTLSAKAYQDHLSNYDNLTGLPNRSLYIKQLDREIIRSKNENSRMVVLDIGLDRFRQINKTLGHNTGDAILKMMAARMQGAIRNHDVIGVAEKLKIIENIARISGDEFSVLLCDMNSLENAATLCKRLLSVVTKKIVVDGKELFLSANIGVAMYPEDGDSVESLIKNASTARDISRKNGKNNFTFYSCEMNEQASKLLKLETDLRCSLEKNEFELHYQPKIDLKTRAVMGAECLIRWKHPEDGYISPEVFIPVAEEMDLIIPIGKWVLNQACNRGAEWAINQNSHLRISVNVSAKQFLSDGFKDSVAEALHSSGLRPQNLVLEITESMLMGDVEKYLDILNNVKSLGVSFSLDDFGTGYSSLSYLKKFPIEELKIDRSFLQDVPESEDDNAIVKAIISMAHSLGQTVVAEGVEEKAQVDFLNKHNCDTIQGYYYSKALSQDAFNNYLTIVRCLPFVASSEG